MGTEAFYTTAGQVLPTILIALTVELGFLLQWLRRLAAEQREYRIEDHARRNEALVWRLLVLSAVLGFTFFVGEVFAFLALGFRWYNIWTFVPIGICMLVMVGGAFLVPLMRLVADTDSA